ncbi:hypothetical protein ACHAXR_001084, partial [Thalassiosira sp. AJA248-18]
MAATTAASTATAICKYTYTLGRSLYVPITSRCNSIPLPSTRGPEFVLPRSVAESLIRVRNAEAQQSSSMISPKLYDDYWLEDDRVGLPPYDLPLVNGLYQFNNASDDDNYLSRHVQQQREIAAAQQKQGGGGGGGECEEVLDDLLEPSIATLVDEVSYRLDNEPTFDQVVIAGEGESTLRMDALLAVARSVQSFRQENKDYDNTRGEQQSKQQRSSSVLPVRVITNGLCYGIPNFGYSPQNLERSGVILPMHRHVILRDMVDAGISRLSVALNTANRHEYDVLME